MACYQDAIDWIMIITNANDESILLGQNLIQFIPGSARGHVIFITTNKRTAVKLAGDKNIERIDRLPISDSRKLLLSLLGQKNVPRVDDTDITGLLRIFDHHTLSIVLIGADISAKSISVSAYLRAFFSTESSATEHLCEVLDKERLSKPGTEDDGIHESLVHVLMNSLKRLQQTHPKSADILSYMYCFSNRGIPRAFLHSEALTARESDRTEALRILTGYCYITSYGKEDIFDVQSVAGLDQLDKTLPWEDDFDKSAFDLFDTHSTHVEAILSHEEITGDKVQVKAALATRYARYLFRKGCYVQAIQFAEKATAWHASSLTADDETVLSCGIFEATILRHGGQFERARQIDEEVLKKQQMVQGKKHRETIATTNLLGCDLYRLGLYEEARKLQERALSLGKEVLGTMDDDTLLKL